MAITLPLVLVLIDVYPLRRFAAGGDPRGVSRVLIEKIPFLALSIGSAVITLVAQESGGAVHALEGSPLGERLIVAVKALGTYLWKMLVPAGLSPYYPYPKEVTVLSAGFALAVAAIVAVTAGCAYAWKRGWKALMIAWLFFLVTMMPVLGIVRIGTHEIAERYTYIPSMGVFMVLALGVAVGYERLRGGAGDRSGNLLGLVVALVVVFVGLGWLTTAQIKVWSDSVSLWSAVIERFPDALKAYYSRAEYYIFAGRHRDALKDLDRAVELSPGSAGAYYYRGIVYLNIGQFDKAVADLTKAIERDPANAVAYFYRGGAFFKSARYQEALGDYTYFLNSSAGEKTAEGYYNRGVVLSRLGRHEDAVRDLTSSIDSPDNRDVSIRYKAYLERSAVSLRRGDHGGALKDSDQAIALNPEDKRAYYQKAAVYYAAGDFQNAIRVYSEIIARSPQDSEAYGKRATVYLRLSRQDDALRDFQQAARLGDTRSREFLTKQGHRW